MSKAGILGMMLMTAGMLWADHPTLTLNRVQQRYPWNGLVDVTVTIQGTADRTEIDLPGSSGYGYFTEKGLGDLGGSRLLATLDFGGGAAVWSNYLRLHGGLIMIFR